MSVNTESGDELIKRLLDQDYSFSGPNGSEWEARKQSAMKLLEYEDKLDAVAEALGHPKGAWKTAGCDVLAHYVRDIVNNYIALRDANPT